MESIEIFCYISLFVATIQSAYLLVEIQIFSVRKMAAVWIVSLCCEIHASSANGTRNLFFFVRNSRKFLHSANFGISAVVNFNVFFLFSFRTLSILRFRRSPSVHDFRMNIFSCSKNSLNRFDEVHKFRNWCVYSCYTLRFVFVLNFIFRKLWIFSLASRPNEQFSTRRKETMRSRWKPVQKWRLFERKFYWSRSLVCVRTTYRSLSIVSISRRFRDFRVACALSTNVLVSLFLCEESNVWKLATGLCEIFIRTINICDRIFDLFICFRGKCCTFEYTIAFLFWNNNFDFQQFYWFARCIFVWPNILLLILLYRKLFFDSLALVSSVQSTR